MVATGFSNSYTSGEIAEDAWDRTELQPVAKGCEEATNLVIRIAGPLGKRRGFWQLGPVYVQAQPGRLVPFRRSVDDALMLEFGHLTVRVWNNDGSPYLDGGVQVQFASPYAGAQLPGLRHKQVADVIYIRHRDGLRPRTLIRVANNDWRFIDEFFPNGPWLGENDDLTITMTVTGTDEADANPDTGAGSILVNQAVALVASTATFQAAHAPSGKFRVRQTDGNPGVKAWSAGYRPAVGNYALSAGRVYRETVQGADDKTVTNPPAQISGLQSDGGNTWDYRHDGAGVIRIDAVADSTHATGTVRKTLPFKSGEVTAYFSEMAWGDYRGWPRMWPGLREERLVEGATASNLDMLDLTELAGFGQLSETFTPGLGSGQVSDVDAIRKRVGDDGGELIWAVNLTWLVVGSASGEYVFGGTVLEEGLTPVTAKAKQVSAYGSADHLPAIAHGGLLFIAKGGQTLRSLTVDSAKDPAGEDLTVLAGHIGARGLAQLAWMGTPDETLWLRLADGGQAQMVYHKEQNVRGFCRAALAGGFLFEDIVTLPGPGKRETLWAIVRRTKDGGDQRLLWMLSQPSDGLFMDASLAYAGAPHTVIGGLGHLEGEVVRVLADGVQISGLRVAGGSITLPAAASTVLVGLGFATRFKSLKLDTQLGGALNERQRVAGCVVSVKTTECTVRIDGFTPETVSSRTAGDVPGAVSRRTIKEVTFAGDTSRDPRIVVEEDTAYDHVIYSLKPKVVRL